MSRNVKTMDPTRLRYNGFEPVAVFSYSKRFPGEFVCTKPGEGRVPRRFVSILISSALVYTDGEMELK